VLLFFIILHSWVSGVNVKTTTFTNPIFHWRQFLWVD
jgi:hypothetical protein